jgi:hypothetical protein
MHMIMWLAVVLQILQLNKKSEKFGHIGGEGENMPCAILDM